MSGLGGAAGAGVAAAVALHRRRILNAFRDAGATRPEGARSLAVLQLRDSRMFRRLVGQRVIVEVSAGQFYLDPVQERVVQSARRRRAVVLVCVALVAIALIYWWQRPAP